ncbi:hypothetical protein VTL71DRAFT_11136 [Oculimacula yallundae]|uniref:Small EDRK-rich factor-like N-terminal domain-containing protein n=1 Tax=Oculimacula yallundae TaxID=86028 RepID=A0ABR4CVC5_9HELO
MKAYARVLDSCFEGEFPHLVYWMNALAVKDVFQDHLNARRAVVPMFRELQGPRKTHRRQIPFHDSHAGKKNSQEPSRTHRGHLKSFEMARGNQRDKAREANQKKLADQKKGNSMTGSEMQREKEKVAQKMRDKQAAADAKKAAESEVDELPRRCEMHIRLYDGVLAVSVWIGSDIAIRYSGC